MFLAALLSAAFLSGQSPSPHPVAVFVGPVVRDGFVEIDRGVKDAIRDIQEEVRGMRPFTLVAHRDAATIVIEVAGRRVVAGGGAVGVTTGGNTVYGGGVVPAVTTMVPLEGHLIDWVLHVGAYEQPVTTAGPVGWTWRSAAKNVVKDLAAWAAANEERLRPVSAVAPPPVAPPLPSPGPAQDLPLDSVTVENFALTPVADDAYRLVATLRNITSRLTVSHVRLKVRLEDCTETRQCELLGETETILFATVPPTERRPVESLVLFSASRAPRLHHREGNYYVVGVFGR